MKKFLCALMIAMSLFAFTSCDTELSTELAQSAVSDSSFDDYEEEETAELTEEDSDESSEEDTEASETEQTEAETEAATEAETEAPTEAETEAEPETEAVIDEYGTYTTKEDVALYIHTYGCLPQNFITKKEAQNLGWPGGSLEPYAPGMCIGGSYFGNYEGILPEADGREYHECDIDTLGADKRGAKRIVYSNDGLIYYTDDHYETFELLYGEE